MIDKFTIERIQSLPIEQIAERLGLGEIRRHKTFCPFHDDSHPSLTFDVRRNRYRCYVCDAHGGVIDLVMNTLHCSFVEACRWLGAETPSPLTYHPSPKFSHPSPITPHPSPDIPYLERLMAQPVLNSQARRFLFDERKLNPDVIAGLGLSSISYNCPMSSSPRPSYFDGPALLIPYRDIDGKLLSVQSRYLGDGGAPRFRFPKGSNCHTFNLPVLRTLKEGEPLFITEGVSDCLAMLSAEFKSVAIPSATLLKPEDLRQLSSVKCHMYPDRDEPGERLFLQLKQLLPSLIHHTLPEGFKDVGQYYAHIQSLKPLNP